MQPYVPGQDVFQTQADQRFNSFSDPMNGVNMNPGNWGLNPYYMTPSYLSPYRPQYQGPQGNMYPNQPGWLNSANHLFNPFESGGTNYGGSVQAQNQPYYNQFTHKPMDAIMAATQKAVAPAALTYYSYKYLSRGAGAMGAGLAGGTMQGALGRYAATGMGGTAISAARTAGGLFGTAFVPFAAATAAMAGVDAAIFDPYTSQRQVSDNLRTNFSGVYMGGGHGNSITGRGFSGRGSADIASQIAKMGARDLTFSQNEMATLTDYSARSGLLDNAQGGQITNRMRDIVKQVKTVMSVANTSDFKEAVEIIAKLQQAGASGIGMTSALAGLGAGASMAGISAQRLMNTTGQQGQFLFQANGMTPYVGMTTAGAAHGAMASAFRSGLISPALMARMGGVEGATQSSTAGLVAALQTPYSAIRGMNAYFGGGETGSIVGNMAKFGGRMATDSLAQLGGFNMMRPALASRMADDRGIQEVHDLALQVGKMTPGAMKNGKLDSRAAYQILTSTYGLTHEQAMASLNQIKANQDPGTSSQMIGAIDAGGKDFNLQWANQNGLRYGLLTPMVQGGKAIGREIQAAGTGLTAPILKAAGSATDWLSEFWTKGMHGISRDQGAISPEMLTAGLTGTARSRLSGNSELAQTLNKLAAQGNPAAIKAINGTAAEKRGAIDSLKLQGHIKGETSSILSDLSDLKAESVNANSVNALGDRAKGVISSGDGDVRGRNARVNWAGGFGGSHKARGFADGADILDLGHYGALIGKYKQAKIAGNEEEANALASQIKKINGNADLSVDDKGYIKAETDYLNKLQVAGIGNLKDVAGELGYSPEEIRRIVSEKDEAGLSQIKAKAQGKYGAAAKGLTFENLQSGLAHLSGAEAVEAMKYTSGDSGEVHRRAEMLAGLQEQKDRIRRLRDSGQIDFSQATAMENALDNKQVVWTFKDAVDLFAKSVETQTGKSITSSGGGGSSASPRGK